ncbi:hypothetical protein DEA8626_00512 [Defluviimonas aquaemixtae]|uniref:Uncharacterized protein n=1 Tax=Albidovulum aquaemixtae TaxID=1542388 RepID=A0A2R8B325_9RHOB|nr:hypothetical protein [Defluviimonas aquaemixtae]SPH16998.1 hypothetical protein DEA8626_00512 [Defluviimonas aquaemixtae]
MTTEILDRESLLRWLETVPPADVARVAFRIAARVLPVAELAVWDMQKHSHFDRDAPRAALAAIRSVLLLQIVANRPAELSTERVISFVDRAEEEWIGLEDTFTSTSAAALAASLHGLICAILYRQPDAHFTRDDSNSVLRSKSSVDALEHARSYAIHALYIIAPLHDPYGPEGINDLLSEFELVKSNRLPSLTLSAPISELWAKARNAWSSRGSDWDFWIRWYEDLLAGREPDWALLKRIALIDDQVWAQGAGAVNAEIGRLIKAVQQEKADPDRAVEDAVRTMSPPKTAVAKKVRTAIEEHRDALPPTFDAIEGLIALEVEHEQRRNYTDDFDLAEAKRRIGVLLVLHSAITRLRATVPATGPVPTANAVEAEKLLRLYGRKLCELPRAKVDEVVEGVWGTATGATKVGLILGSGALAGYFGLPALGGMIAGSMVFAPKNAAEVIKAAKEYLSTSN